MSTLKGTRPVPSPQTCDGSGRFRYEDAGCLKQDWFATHPRPVEKKVIPVEVVETKVAPVETPVIPAPVVETPAPEIVNEAAPSDPNVPQV